MLVQVIAQKLLAVRVGHIDSRARLRGDALQGGHHNILARAHRAVLNHKHFVARRRDRGRQILRNLTPRSIQVFIKVVIGVRRRR
ncbi:hypothetical protein SDC9_158441 [bioreactor metagenome]|uniref:Uncharacterized protein n=1 Tax=bioreactor metagenome TaxID=1076179 RepID=A0A645FB45_9ZZZZ